MTKIQTTFERFLISSEKKLWQDFQEAAEYVQTVDIGTVRENTVARFLREHLPSRYIVCSGELIDSYGNRSGQTDIMIYDGMRTCPLRVDGASTMLPVEALLATVEVKTSLNQTEIDKSLKGIDKIHKLKPWGRTWGMSRRMGGEPDSLPRFLSSVFAYETNLTKEDWAKKEMLRFRDRAKELKTCIEYVDRLVILDKGVAIPSSGKVMELREKHGALSVWFFSLVNFLDREVRRRSSFPWDSYQLPDKRSWREVLPPQFDAPGIVIPTQAKRNRERRRALSKNTNKR